MFKVFKRYEMPKAEYSYDMAFNKIVELNSIYNPAWIYCDRGSGEYIIERLHIFGNEHPETGLHLKVKGWQFAQVLDIYDPVMKRNTREPMKPFMVNQLVIAFERKRMILSPFDETLHKQLVDYTVERIGKNGPVFCSINEHFVDALGLAYLAFVLEFSALVNTIKEEEYTSKAFVVKNTVGARSINQLFNSIKDPYSQKTSSTNRDNDDCKGDRPPDYTVYKNAGLSISRISHAGGSSDWGSRNILRSHNTNRRMW
jgi:replicative DNA helicase